MSIIPPRGSQSSDRPGSAARDAIVAWLKSYPINLLDAIAVGLTIWGLQTLWSWLIS